MSVLRDRVIEEHINKYYPNSKIVNYDEASSDLVFYSSEELQMVEDDWFPLCCYKDKDTGKAMYGGRKKVFHTYTEGETGAGKTTRFVMQSILALSSLKIKPSFVIVDIHGEIIENLYNHLKKNGYSIKILNCDNPQRSDTYNPFSELVKECLRTRTINNDTINKIRKISEIIQPIESSNDPIWDQGARAYTNGCILDKFEDLINGDMPQECVTIYNVIQNHYWLREALTSSYTNDLFKLPHYKKKGTKALSTQKMISVTNNADKTRASYFGVVENHYDIFGQPSLYSLSSNNTIDISDFINNPTVIVIQSGSTKIGDDLISLLVNDIYTQVVKIGKESQRKKLPRNIHCFLDEFANCNIADGPEYIKMLTTSRKFGMFWHMILQCDAQLDRKFDPNIGRIIRANSTEIFMGSHDYETEVRFAKSCGQKTIESLSSVIAQQDPRLEVVDLMTPERLNLTEEGYVYVKSNKHPLTKTYLEAFYNCDEFESVENIDEVYPYNRFDYQQTSFYPDDLPPRVSNAEYEILKYIGNTKTALIDISNEFSMYDVNKLVKSLAQKKTIELLPDHFVKRNLTQRQFALYRYRYENDLCIIVDIEAERKTTTSPLFSNNNPFDFDIPPSPQEQSNSVIDSWFDSSDIGVSPLYSELKEHLQKIDKGSVEVMEKVTLIPSFIKSAVEDLCNGDPNDSNKREGFPNQNNILKFEIIEEFIKNNNYSNKNEWEEHMQDEYDLIVKSNLFPKVLLDAFKKALDTVKDELTLSNIKEIKKILSENSWE